MLEMPRRSVTRFFIPLIDVLTLLFCVFLMMPAAKPGDGSGPRTPEERARYLQQELASQKSRYEDTIKDLEARLAQAQKVQIQNLKAELWVRILQLDRQGRIFTEDPDRPGASLEIGRPEQAQRLVQRDRREHADQKVYYLVLYPKRGSNVTSAQLSEFENVWFRGATVGFGTYSDSSGAGEK
jgi:hypothetical protein